MSTNHGTNHVFSLSVATPTLGANLSRFWEIEELPQAVSPLSTEEQQPQRASSPHPGVNPSDDISSLYPAKHTCKKSFPVTPENRQ